MKNVEYFTDPFSHWTISNFFDNNFASFLEADFFDFYSDSWGVLYDSPVQIKKTQNSWDKFPENIYKAFTYLCSNEFTNELKELTGIKTLYPDFGLHGGGMHIHSTGGKLNLHKDYSLHPKLGLQRKLNIIVYLNSSWQKEWGGELELWSHDYHKNLPKNKIKSVPSFFNTAFIFDTTQNSWHGFPDQIKFPKNEYRKSIAMFYLTEPCDVKDTNKRAMFAPSDNQKNDESVLNFIKNYEKK